MIRSCLKTSVFLVCLSLSGCFFDSEEIIPTGPANAGWISGIVKDGSTQFGIPDAGINIEPLGRIEFADSSGSFLIPQIPPGDYMIISSKDEYKSDTSFASVTPGDTTVVNISLSFNSDYWSIPTDDASVLFFRQSDLVRIDSTLAGKIQFRLDVARTVDMELDSIQANVSWEFGKLLIKVPDSIYHFIDFQSRKFNYTPIDSLLVFYHLYDMDSLFQTGTDYWIALTFHRKYNMPVLGKKFEQIPGVIHATPNSMGVLPGGPPSDIYLTIESDTYIFTFVINDWDNNYIHHWKVQVVDTSAVLVDEW